MGRAVLRAFFLSFYTLNATLLGNTSTMSVASGIIDGLLRLSGASKEITENAFYKEMRKSAIEIEKEAFRRYRFSGVRMENGVYCGMNYLLFFPEVCESTKCVMYIHGSGYMKECRHTQLRFGAELAKNLHAKVYFPFYPKLPAATVVSSFALLNNFYAFLAKKGEVCLVGDSSGASLALSLAAEQASVRSVVAISPWVLLRVGKEGRNVSTDLMLSLSRLEYAAEIWRNGLEAEDVRLSPFYGRYAGKRLLLVAGEKELFRPDILRFFHEQSQKGTEVTYLEGKGQQHCFPLMPTPEGKAAREEIYRKMRVSLYGERVRCL